MLLVHIVALVAVYTHSQERKDEAWRKMSFEEVQNTPPVPSLYPEDAKPDIPAERRLSRRPP